jgi:UPF0716 protein FxsA
LRLSLLPLLVLALPLAEIAVFVMVGSEIGVFATIGLILLSAMLGIVLLRVQGIGTLARIQKRMEVGEDPCRDLVHGVMIMFAGILLLIPGFITDTLGLLLFLPPVRDAGWRFLKSRIVHVNIGGMRPGGAPRGKDRGPTIDLEEEEYYRAQAEKGRLDGWKRDP